MDYLYVDTTPWDKTRHDKEAEITGGSNPVGLKGVIRFLKDRKEFDLKNSSLSRLQIQDQSGNWYF